MKTFKSILKVWLCAFFSIALVASATVANATQNVNDTYQSLPFPIEMKRYETQIFNLLDKSAADSRTKQSQYDKQFSEKFKEALKPYLKLDPRLDKKLLSGPAPEGKYIRIGKADYFYYEICQAHSCNITNISILYQYNEKRMVGRLQYQCNVYPLNGTTQYELAAIDKLSPIKNEDEFYQRSCAMEGRENK